MVNPLDKKLLGLTKVKVNAFPLQGYPETFGGYTYLRRAYTYSSFALTDQLYQLYQGYQVNLVNQVSQVRSKWVLVVNYI